MASLSVDGLVSGLDTTSLINQLIAAERSTQTSLKTRLKATQDSATAYRTINSKVDALRTAAEDLAKATTWSAAKASVPASSGVSVALTGTAATGQLSFTVESLAAAHSVLTDGRWPSATGAGALTELTLTTGGTATTVPVGGTGSLADAVAAINASNAGVSAGAVRMDDGTYALMLTARKSGAANAFSVDGVGTVTTLAAGADARLRLGSATGPAVSSPSNTFTELLPGGTLTVSQTTTAPVTVEVVSDPDAVAGKVQAFVDAANAALADIKRLSASTGGAAAVLKGDATLSRLTSEILGAVSAAVGAEGSPGAAGVQLTRTGTVAFDKTVFLGKLQSDPELTRRLFAGTPASGTDPAVDGVAQRLQAVAKKATDTTTGTLTKLAEGRDTMARDYQDRIEDWDVRLETRRATLVRQFTAMETALSSLKQQSSWLAGQLASLPSSS
jgi:flagellar hook-associated protein 2